MLLDRLIKIPKKVILVNLISKSDFHIKEYNVPDVKSWGLLYLVNFLNGEEPKYVNVIPKPHCLPLECHNNVDKYVDMYGGKKITGYYLLNDINNINNVCAIKHSVWLNTYDQYIDITPFKTNKILFSIVDVPKEKAYEYYNGELFIVS